MLYFVIFQNLLHSCSPLPKSVTPSDCVLQLLYNMSYCFQFSCIYDYLLCEPSQNKIIFFLLDQLISFKDFDSIFVENIHCKFFT